MPSKVPAHSSLFVRKGAVRLKIFLTVAGIDEWSNSEVGDGDPLGPWTTAFIIVNANNKLLVISFYYSKHIPLC